MMKRFILISVMVVSVLSLMAQDVRKEEFIPFYTKDVAPRMEMVIPEPPALTDSRFFADWTQYLWGKSIRDTERGELAIADAGISAEYFMKRFSDAVERQLTPDEYPTSVPSFRPSASYRAAGWSQRKGLFPPCAPLPAV